MTEDGPDLQYLQTLYDSGDDPWQISVGFYEHRKRCLLLESLTQQRYARAFEPGCASGELTAALAQRCDSVLAADANADAVRITADRLAGVPSVQVRQLIVPAQWPTETEFDLIVLSEIGYFMALQAWRELAAVATETLAATGTIVACHWRHAFAERRSQTPDLHDVLARSCAQAEVRHCLQLQDEDFLLDVWTRSAMSPARREQRW